MGRGQDDVVIGHLANNSREKGSIDLLTAAERAWRQGGGFHLVLAGPEMPNFRGFWRQLWAGWPGAAAGRAGRGAEAQLLRRDRRVRTAEPLDSFGIVLLEAWANGAANIGYRAGGLAWVIRHEEDGLLVKCGDVDGLAAALLRLAGDGGCVGGSARRGARGRGQSRVGRQAAAGPHMYQALSQGGGIGGAGRIVFRNAVGSRRNAFACFSHFHVPCLKGIAPSPPMREDRTYALPGVADGGRRRPDGRAAYRPSGYPGVVSRPVQSATGTSLPPAWAFLSIAAGLAVGVGLLAVCASIAAAGGCSAIWPPASPPSRETLLTNRSRVTGP